MPDKYTLTRSYPITTETYNGYDVTGVVTDDLTEDIACLVPQCPVEAYWVTVHMVSALYDC